MAEAPERSPREQSRFAVRRLTAALAALSVAATALFGAFAASASRHATTSTGSDDSAVVQDDSSGDGFYLAPSQGVWSTPQQPTATSGGS